MMDLVRPANSLLGFFSGHDGSLANNVLNRSRLTKAPARGCDEYDLKRSSTLRATAFSKGNLLRFARGAFAGAFRFLAGGALPSNFAFRFSRSFAARASARFENARASGDAASQFNEKSGTSGSP
jgi:hypothetical protein